MSLRIDSDGIELRSHFAVPESGVGTHGVVFCHGFPRLAREAMSAGLRYPEVADRIAAQLGMAVLTFNFRGTGQSSGNFSMKGWETDLNAAVKYILEQGVSKVWVVGFGTGGSLAICVAAKNTEISGVAAFAARAHFDDWAAHGEDLAAHARTLGMIRDDEFPSDLEAWTNEFRTFRPVSLVHEIAPRPLLIVHGRDDERVPSMDARELAAAAGPTAELRIISNAEHRLQSDPRTVALLLGWLDLRK